MDSFAIFERAQKNLEKRPNSQIDQFIVDLWNASKNLNAKVIRLRAEIDTLREEMKDVDDRQNLKVAALYHQLEISQSRQRDPSIPAVRSAAEYIESLKQVAQQ